MVKNLIIIKQLPQIEEHLKKLSMEVEQKVENAKSLVCIEENVKTIKQVRADLNKELKEVEQQRKQVKEQEVKDYFEEYKTANNIDFVTYEQARINVTLSASMKRLKEQAKQFIDKIVDP